MFEGIQGIQKGLKGLNQAARDMAELNLDDKAAQPGAMHETAQANAGRANGSPDTLRDTVTAVTDLMTHKRQIQASAKAVEASDQALGFLIDIRV